jgi:glycosyltransferase involved in cell wall biosynthesis
MITYGHEKFIQKAIEGVLMQKCNFDVELIVANDCSPDNTDIIINEIINTHKKAYWINYIKHEKNIGMMPNFMYTLQQSNAKYIAICEGDDYWTDPYKLQKQVDFLEANSEYVLCFTNTKIKTNTSLVDNNLIVPKNYENIETLAYIGNYIHTPTVVFKNIIQEFPNQFNNSPIGDYFIYMLLTEKGKIYFIDEYTTVYRKHVGTFSSLDNNVQYQKMTTCRAILYDYFNTKNNTKIAKILKNKIVQYFRDTDKIFTVNEIKNITKNDDLTLAIYEYFYIFCKQKNFIKSISSMDLVKIFIQRLLKKIKIKK